MDGHVAVAEPTSLVAVTLKVYVSPAIGRGIEAEVPDKSSSPDPLDSAADPEPLMHDGGSWNILLIL